MKSFTVESILGVSDEKTFSAPDYAPVQRDVIIQHHSSNDQLAARRQQQLHTEQGSFLSALTLTFSSVNFIVYATLLHINKQ